MTQNQGQGCPPATAKFEFMEVPLRGKIQAEIYSINQFNNASNVR